MHINSRPRLMAGSLLLLALISSAAFAGQMNLSLGISRLDATTFDPLAYTTNPDGSIANGQPGYYVVDVFFTAQDEANDKGWFNSVFDANTTGHPGLVLDFAGGWTPETGTVDINGPAFGGVVPVYAVNQDGGVAGDLQDIIASLQRSSLPSNHAFDRRNEVGTANAPTSVGFPSHLGYFGVIWDGISQAHLNLTGLSYIFSQLDNSAGAEETSAGVSQQFGENLPPQGVPVVIPEPPVIASYGDIVLIDFDATDVDTPAGPFDFNVSLLSFVPVWSGAINQSADATIDDNGLFRWDTLGASRGVYTYGITATDPSGLTSSATPFTVVLFVPEPSTMSLFVLAMFGTAGFARHRNS